MIRLVIILTLFTAFKLASQSNSSFGWSADQPTGKDLIITSFNRSSKSPFPLERDLEPAPHLRRIGLSKDTTRQHSPKLASIYSAVLPGLGQAYNRKYWKIPIVLAGLGTAGWFIKLNRDSMRNRQDALIARLDNDSNTNAAGQYANISIDILTSQRNQYRTYRDYSIIAFAAIYILNIVDASVDAHFYKFNIDKPLAMQKKRHLFFASSKVLGKPTLGLAYRW